MNGGTGELLEAMLDLAEIPKDVKKLEEIVICKKFKSSVLIF